MNLAEEGDVVRQLLERPDLPVHLQFTWSAFWTLTNDRPPSFGGIAPIGFSSIDRYAARYGIIESDEFERFARLIGAMDAAFRDKVAEDIKTKGSDAPKP